MGQLVPKGHPKDHGKHHHACAVMIIVSESSIALPTNTYESYHRKQQNPVDACNTLIRRFKAGLPVDSVVVS